MSPRPLLLFSAEKRQLIICPPLIYMVVDTGFCGHRCVRNIRYFFAAMSLLYMRFYAIKVRCCRIFNVYIQDRYETEQYINVPPFQVALVISVPCPCLGSCSDDLFRSFHHPYSITTYKRCSPDLRQMLKPSTIGTIYKRNLEERIRQELKAHKCLKLQKVNFPRFLFMTTMIG